jgi:hypothetical protein
MATQNKRVSDALPEPLPSEILEHHRFWTSGQSVPHSISFPFTPAQLDTHFTLLERLFKKFEYDSEKRVITMTQTNNEHDHFARALFAD